MPNYAPVHRGFDSWLVTKLKSSATAIDLAVPRAISPSGWTLSSFRHWKHTSSHIPDDGDTSTSPTCLLFQIPSLLLERLPNGNFEFSWEPSEHSSAQMKPG
jgi:hypothetical protein